LTDAKLLLVLILNWLFIILWRIIIKSKPCFGYLLLIGLFVGYSIFSLLFKELSSYSWVKTKAVIDLVYLKEYEDPDGFISDKEHIRFSYTVNAVKYEKDQFTEDTGIKGDYFPVYLSFHLFLASSIYVF